MNNSRLVTSEIDRNGGHVAVGNSTWESVLTITKIQLLLHVYTQSNDNRASELGSQGLVREMLCRPYCDRFLTRGTYIKENDPRVMPADRLTGTVGSDIPLGLPSSTSCIFHWVMFGFGAWTIFPEKKKKEEGKKESTNSLSQA